MRTDFQPVFDQVSAHYHNPTPAQWDALLRLPVYLDATGGLPPSAPHGGTLKALDRKGYAHWTGHAWERTALGHRLVALAPVREGTAAS